MCKMCNCWYFTPQKSAEHTGVGRCVECKTLHGVRPGDKTKYYMQIAKEIKNVK